MARWLRTELQRASRNHALREPQRRLVWGACSVLLDYPTEELIGRVGLILAETSTLPAAYAQPLGRLLAHLRETELRVLQEEYVATFDHTRRCALFLTYFSYGDTRRRGVALVQFKQAYRKASVEFDADELPDHLCAVLQFGATIDVAGGWRLLLDHRAGVEMLRLALAEAQSPWADAVVAVCATLPELKGDEVDAVRRLIEQGPPAEEVGLEPYLIDPQIPVGPPRSGALR
jgi:nitrate reductase delta subunit